MTKWASPYDLCKPVESEVIEQALDQCNRYVYDATNFIIEYSSSTSGMYGKWYVEISPNTTVKDIRLFSHTPKGVGSDLTEAFQDFTKKMKEFCDNHKFEVVL